MSSSTLLSQELFDETILENEEAFDLSPEEALKETVDQFLSQLGLGGVVCSADFLLGDHHHDDDDDDSGAVTNGAATEGGGLDVAAADGIDTPPRTTTRTATSTTKSTASQRFPKKTNSKLHQSVGI